MKTRYASKGRPKGLHHSPDVKSRVEAALLKGEPIRGISEWSGLSVAYCYVIRRKLIEAGKLEPARRPVATEA